MCEYSLHSVKSRLAKVSDKAHHARFWYGHRGFAASEDMNFARKHQHPLQCMMEEK